MGIRLKINTTTEDLPPAVKRNRANNNAARHATGRRELYLRFTKLFGCGACAAGVLFGFLGRLMFCRFMMRMLFGGRR